MGLFLTLLCFLSCTCSHRYLSLLPSHFDPSLKEESQELEEANRTDFEKRISKQCCSGSTKSRTERLSTGSLKDQRDGQVGTPQMSQSWWGIGELQPEALEVTDEFQRRERSQKI